MVLLSFMTASISCEKEDEFSFFQAFKPVRKGLPLSSLSAAAAATVGKSVLPGSMPSSDKKLREEMRRARPAWTGAKHPACKPSVSAPKRCQPESVQGLRVQRGSVRHH